MLDFNVGDRVEWDQGEGTVVRIIHSPYINPDEFPFLRYGDLMVREDGDTFCFPVHCSIAKKVKS